MNLTNYDDFYGKWDYLQGQITELEGYLSSVKKLKASKLNPFTDEHSVLDKVEGELTSKIKTIEKQAWAVRACIDEEADCLVCSFRG